VAICLVLVFAAGRASFFIPQGEYVAFGALTLALLQTGAVPGTVRLLVLMALAAAALDAWAGVAGAAGRRAAPRPGCCARSPCPRWRQRLAIVLAPSRPSLLAAGAARRCSRSRPMGPARLPGSPTAHSPIRASSFLLIVSVGVRFAHTGLGLLFFGAEGSSARLRSGMQRFTLGPRLAVRPGRDHPCGLGGAHRRAVRVLRTAAGRARRPCARHGGEPRRGAAHGHPPTVRAR
jgi:branched-chain amino acid transport system permease protein